MPGMIRRPLLLSGTSLSWNQDGKIQESRIPDRCACFCLDLSDSDLRVIALDYVWLFEFD
uniref:Uncharacterized protein n=1 Tax=Oryza sativa subsp. japonica TaxID=39947 RepID=Q5QML6_ORYSJ|nr:hypothetical protein [Oryza sativa Japonica Group]BAD82285.1 hypothetical protein [Oryza sativa Japonica Group]